MATKKELRYDLKRKHESVLRLIQNNNKILDILFSSMTPEEKNNKIGWLIINSKITNIEKSYEE